MKRIAMIKETKTLLRTYEKNWEIVRKEETVRTIKIFGIPIFKGRYSYINENNEGETSGKKVGFGK
jgi:hypothetical protein